MPQFTIWINDFFMCDETFSASRTKHMIQWHLCNPVQHINVKCLWLIHHLNNRNLLQIYRNVNSTSLNKFRISNKHGNNYIHVFFFIKKKKTEEFSVCNYILYAYAKKLTFLEEMMLTLAYFNWRGRLRFDVDKHFWLPFPSTRQYSICFMMISIIGTWLKTH